MNSLVVTLGQIVLILMVFIGTTLLHWGVNGYITPVSRLLLGVSLICLAVMGIGLLFLR